MRYGRHCQHEFVDVATKAAVLPFVNVLASPGTVACMTLGRKYRCERCERVIDLRFRARLALPEAPVDSRIELPQAANDARHDAEPIVERRGAARSASASVAGPG